MYDELKRLPSLLWRRREGERERMEGEMEEGESGGGEGGREH